MTGANVHAGGCLCGAVRYEATGPLRDVIACHCTQCRKTSGHVWAASSVPVERFRLTESRGLRWFRSSAIANRGFCGECGSSLFWEPTGEGTMHFGAGTLDGATGLSISSHWYTEDAGDYYSPQGAPPDPVPAGHLDGSCLCGANRFRVDHAAGAVTACHCDQCRRLSGHYSASFDVAAGAIHWQAQGALAEYVTPGGGQRGFCTCCGSSLYFRAADGALSVEAGVIDGPSGGQLAEHIFTGHKGDYYVIDDGLPQLA